MAYAADAKARLLAGDYGRATVHGHEALRLAQRCESWVFAARANLRLGDAAHALGEPMRAAWYWRAGLASYRRVDFPVPRVERERLEDLLAAAG